MRPKTTLPPATSPRFEPRSVKSPSALLSPTSIRDEAALLLSIAPICESEIREDGISFLWTDEEQAPAFPLLVAHEDAYKKNQNLLAPRNVSMDFLPSDTAASRSRTTAELTPAGKLRARAVSMDHQDNLLPDAVFRPLSPKNFKPARKFTSVQRNHRKSSLALGEPRSPVIHKENLSTLQPDFPREALAKRVYRKKFSWKNYPELEAFLVKNRDEYLKHSALNYTVQQKNYNNRLTERLLELATEHGYLFDEKDFNFVTVRDRIRCYYKSFVQSAKKRGILMGYAARKAGLLQDDSSL